MSRFDKIYRKLISEAFGDGVSVDSFERGELPVNVVPEDEAERLGVSEADAVWLHDNLFSVSNAMLEGFVKFEKTLVYDYRLQNKVIAILTYDKRFMAWSCIIKRENKILSKTDKRESAADAFTSAKSMVNDELVKLLAI